MLKIKKEGVLLRATKLPFENLSVLNPGVYQDGKKVHLFYRAIDKNHISSIGYAQFNGPAELVERWDHPFMEPKLGYECCGLEDPRITKIGDTFYMTYVVHDGKNALTAYSYGKDLFNLKKGGIITPKIRYSTVGKLFDESKLKDKYYFYKSYYIDMNARDILLWEKDVFFFPQKIGSRYAMFHRILPDIQVAYFQSFSQLKSKEFWTNHIRNLSKYVVLESRHGFEARNIGGGAPPIRTKYGWLFLYHGVEPLNRGRIYHAGAALLDLKKPTRVIARLPYPLFSPDIRSEKQGMVHDVVFPTGTAQFQDRLFIYYGAGDSRIALASVKLDSLLNELLKYKE